MTETYLNWRKMTADSLEFLENAVNRSLIDPETATKMHRQFLETGESIPKLLVKYGILTEEKVAELKADGSSAERGKIVGQYHIQEELGKGGNGTVYRAVQLSMDRTVALKVMAEHFAQDAEAAERFMREARSAGRVNNPHVVTTYEVGRAGKTLYMALELMEGGDADELLKKSGGKIKEDRALEIIADAGIGLCAIRDADLIHRDIKPQNIFLTKAGRAKLADLGLAKGAGDEEMTIAGATIGTPSYMSPEQANGEHELDIRSDIYSLGASLFHLVTGNPPFTGSTPLATAVKIINDPLPDPRRYGVSDKVAEVIEAAMAKDPDDRYRTPEDFLEAIEKTTGEPVTAAFQPTKATTLRRSTREEGREKRKTVDLVVESDHDQRQDAASSLIAVATRRHRRRRGGLKNLVTSKAFLITLFLLADIAAAVYYFTMMK